MTFNQEVRIAFSKHIEELDRLYALYGHSSKENVSLPYIDTKFMIEKVKDSIFFNTLLNLIKE